MEERNLLMVCASLGVGGAERQWALLAPRLRDHGFSPTIVTLRARGRFFEEVRASGVPVYFADMKNPVDPLGLRRALRLAGTKPDVVLSHSANAQVVGHVVAARARCPHVTNEHRPPGLRRRLHHRAALRLIASRIDLVVAVTGAQTEELGRLGYRPGRIHVVPNGVPAPRPAEPREQTRLRLGATDDAFVAVLAAALRPEKAVEVFVRAVAAAKREDPRIRGFVAGDGPQRETLAAVAADTGDAVRMLGVRKDVAELLNAADAVCLSSSHEGLPMVLLEAMSLARPVVATAVGGVPELVTEETGVLVPPHDVDALAAALVELSADRRRAEALGRAGQRRQRERYSVEPMVEAYVAALRRVSPGAESKAAV